MIFLTATGSNSWTVPPDWNSANHQIIDVGAGGGGGGNYGNTGDARNGGDGKQSAGGGGQCFIVVTDTPRQ